MGSQLIDYIAGFGSKDVSLAELNFSSLKLIHRH